ncbi:MAG: molybdopterin-dependent oxidoreductase, partial [Chloroflexi bacterium]|nr:molybdopterin-dependent oxidoreductase [Chloroflexota bacterium]
MATDTKLVGQSVARREDEKLLRGRGAFVEDIKVPGIQWASLVRSPHAHARIRSIDTSAALQTPGVNAVLTGKDIHPRFGTNPTVSLKFYDAESAPYDLIAVDKARHVGEVVAVVVADTRYGARDAADLIFVDYEPLAPAIEVEKALRDDAPRVHDDRPNGIIHWRYQLGNVSQAFEEAAVIVRERIVNQKIHGVPMEPRAGLAHWDAVQETMSLWATVQTPHALRDHLAEILHLSADNVRVVAPDVGGGFGVKHEDPEYALICIASMHLGVPIKWVATRTEDFLAMHQARGKTSYLEVSPDAA